MSEEKSADINNEKQAEADASVAIPMDDLDESKAHLIKSNANGGAGDVQVGIIDPTGGSSDGDVSFNGLGKDEVLQYANDPFWVRLRWILFILFWVGWTAMLVTAIVIIVLAPRCPPRPDMKWYEKGAVYQVYAKSFKDTAKDDKTPMDGHGDFKGLKEKLDHITDTLGIKAIYLNSVFKTEELSSDPHLSDIAIIDHKMLDDKFGTKVDSFRSWVKDQRKDGIQVILDLIPNQTSKKHEWFMKAVNGDAKYKDYYIWSQTSKDDKNVNGDPAWTLDSTLNEYYYHSLTSDLPDLNLNNEAVREEIAGIMRYWFDAGVGGFRINGIDYLVEDQPGSQGSNETGSTGGTLKYLEDLRSIADSYSDKPGRERFIFATVSSADNSTAAFYQSDSENKEKRLNMVIPELKLDATCNAQCLMNLMKPITMSTVPWVGLQLSNENTQRIGARLETHPVKKSALNMAYALQLLLPGTPFNYYGDEFGQKGGVMPEVDGKYNPMNARTPMQWNGRTNVGFTDANVSPWLPVGSDYQNDNVELSRAHFKSDSVMKSFQKLVELRERESFQWGKLKACAYDDNVLLFTRKAEGFPYFLTLINAGSEIATVHIPSVSCIGVKDKKGTVKFHSEGEDEGEMIDLDDAVYLNAGDVAVIEFAV